MIHKIKVTHNSGLFSCFSQRLSAIIKYANENKVFPDIVDSSEQFLMYKTDKSVDITETLIQNLDNKISFTKPIHFTDQFTDYSKLDFSLLNPIIGKYFSISDIVKNRLNKFIVDYDIDFFDTCSIFYRGNDKRLECKLATPEMFIEKAQTIKNYKKSIKFLVQTDDTDFLNQFTSTFKDSIYFRELPTIHNKSMSVSGSLPENQRLNHAIDLLAAVNIVARCKYLVTHSGNCGYWASLYRGGPDGIIQHFTNEANENYGWIL